MVSKLYSYRFELFLFTQISILFGSLVIPINLFENWVMPVLILSNIGAGILLASKKKRLLTFLFVVLAIVTIVQAVESTSSEIIPNLNYIKLASYFVFYTIVTVEIISQVWSAKKVGKNVILGLIAGYISIGLIGFFLCVTIDLLHPNSFTMLVTDVDAAIEKSDQLMYFSYITLMTIGYGDILPVSSVAQKASIFIGLMGQFYLVILTAIVVGKYINQRGEG